MSYDGSLKFDTAIDTSGFDSGVATIGKIAAGTVTAIAGAMTAVSAAAVKVGGDFEAGMSQVAAISGATVEELNALTAKAAEMGASTKFTATEAAEGLNYMAQAGWKTEDMLNSLTGVMNLAAASGEGLASVSDIVTDAMTAFGLQAKQSGHFADVLATASAASNTNVSMMGATFKYVAPVAGALKYSIEDTAAAIGLLANAGIKGEQAGTQLRAMFSRLVDPPKEAAEAMAELGIVVTNSDGSMKPLSETINILRGSFAGLSDSQKASYASMLAGQEAMSGMLTLVNASEEDYNNLAEAITNADGSAEDMANTMNDNLKGKVTILQSALEGLGITIYDSFANPMKSAAESATEEIDALNNSIKNGKLSDSVSKIAAAFSNTAESIMGVVTDKVLPALINGFSWVIENGNTLTILLAGIAANMLLIKNQSRVDGLVTSWRAANKAVKAHDEAMRITTVASLGGLNSMQTVIALFTRKITLATAATSLGTKAQYAFNTAVAANPLGAAVAAITAVIAVVSLLVNVYTKAKKEADEVRKSIDELEESENKQVATVQAECQVLKNKADRYEYLRTKIKRTKEEETELYNLAKELQEIIPENCNLINAEAKAYGNITEAINKVIAAKTEEAQSTALNNIMVKKYEAIYEAQEVLNDLTKKYDDLLYNGDGEGHEDGPGGNWRLWGSIDLDRWKEQTALIEDYKTEIAQAQTDVSELLENGAKDISEAEDKQKQSISEYWENDTIVAKKQKELNLQQSIIQKTIKTFEEEKEALDRLRNRSLISDSEYYNELERLLNEHHISDTGETQKYYDELIVGRNQLNETLLKNQENSNQKLIAEQEKALKEQEKQQNKAFKDWSDDADKTIDEYNKKCSGIVSQRESMQSKLASFGSLFEITKDEKTDKEIVKLQNLQEQTKQLIDYREQLNRLQAAGASSDFMAEVSSMNIDDANKFMTALLDSGQLEDYLKAYEEKQKTAAEIAKQFYDTQLETIQTEFADKIQSVFEGVPEDMELVGQDTVQGFIDGINAKLQEISDKGFEVGNTFADSLKKSLDIHSPSRITMQLGDYTGQDFMTGLNKYKDLAGKSAADISENIKKGLQNINMAEISGRIRAITNMPFTINSLNRASPQGGNTSNTNNTENTFNVNIDPKNISEFNDIVNICKNAQQKARAR